MFKIHAKRRRKKKSTNPCKEWENGYKKKYRDRDNEPHKECGWIREKLDWMKWRKTDRRTHILLAKVKLSGCYCHMLYMNSAHVCSLCMCNSAVTSYVSANLIFHLQFSTFLFHRCWCYCVWIFVCHNMQYEHLNTVYSWYTEAINSGINIILS